MQVMMSRLGAQRIGMEGMEKEVAARVSWRFAVGIGVSIFTLKACVAAAAAASGLSCVFRGFLPVPSLPLPPPVSEEFVRVGWCFAHRRVGVDERVIDRSVFFWSCFRLREREREESTGVQPLGDGGTA